MRRFITRITLLAVPFLLVIIGMELGLRNIPSDYKLKKDYLDANSNQVETLILGSSHAFFGIDPQYFSSKTFNASYLSQSLDFDSVIFNYYLNEFSSLKTIVLPISYFTLFSRLELSPEAWRGKNYDIYYKMNLYENLFKYSELLKNKFNISVQKLISFYIRRKTPIISNYLGWGTTYKSEDALDLLETGKAAALKHFGDIDFKIKQSFYRKNVSLINLIIEWCENNNIELILLTLPAYESYRENLNSQQLNITIETANAFDSISNNCRYFNFFEDSTFIAKDFYDADHLSEIGAKKLSRILSSKLDEFEN